jgi:hypothetical protein
LQIQTAVNTLPIPILYGCTRTAFNLIWFNNFNCIPVFQGQTQPATGIFGGLFGGGSTTSYSVTGYYYTSDVMLALCEGPISGIGLVWAGNVMTTFSGYSPSFMGVPVSTPIEVLEPYTFTPPGGKGTETIYIEVIIGWTAGIQNNNYSFNLFDGISGQSTWAYLAASDPSQALNYNHTAYLALNAFNLGSSASLPQMTFEVFGILYGTGANGIDADPAQVIADFLTNPQYGVGLSGNNIYAPSLIGSSGDSSTQTYCRATGRCFSPLLNQGETASSILTRWLQLMNIAAVWSGKWLKFIPYGDTNVSGNSTSYSYNSGTNTWTPTYTNYSWVAPISTVYALTDADLVYREGEDPIKVSRIDPYNLPTVQWVEVLNRTGAVPAPAGFTQPNGNPAYQATPISARDQAMIEMYGLRVGDSITAHEVCDLNVGATIAQTILQRVLYVRSTYKFNLSWECCLLDPMDVVSLTDYNLGLNNTPVRIIEITEDDTGMLSITAEELTIGVSTPIVNPTANSGIPPNTGISAGSATPINNPPLIYEPPAAATTNALTLWLGASPATSGSAITLPGLGSIATAQTPWLGDYVWVSTDGTNYQQITPMITSPTVQGLLTANLPLKTGYDTTNTLSVNLTECSGTLANFSQSQAQAGLSLCLIDGELIAYATVTLTSTYNYNITGIQRGMFGTTPALHTTGANFFFIGSVPLVYNYPASYIGITLYFKFQSYANGGAPQSLSSCAVYTFTPSGNSYKDPVVSALLQGITQDWLFCSQTAQIFSDWGAASVVSSTSIDLGNCTS